MHGDRARPRPCAAARYLARALPTSASGADPSADEARLTCSCFRLGGAAGAEEGRVPVLPRCDSDGA